MRHSVRSVGLLNVDERLHRIIAEPSDSFASAYGASLGENLPVLREVVSQTLALFANVPRAPEWGGYLVVDSELALVVGTCGFAHGPGEDGAVEIAYFTFPEFEGRGYATAMATELVRRAISSEAVREVVALTLPERNASTRILEKVGLKLVGEAQDPDAGTVWRWGYRREQPG